MVRSVGAPAERAPAPRHGSRGLALAVLTMVLFLTFLDNTIVSVALGSVQAELHAGVSALQWVVGAYALTFAGAMLAFGMVGDEFGRKRVMLIGVGIFCAGSVLSALAPNIDLVIAGRAVMGFGAAASEPGTLSMLRHLYTEARTRTRAVGVWAAVSGLALALGPVIGGALVGAWNWRAIFWFNLVFGLAALVAGLIVLPENSDPDAHRVDIPGAHPGRCRPDRPGLRGDRGGGRRLHLPQRAQPARPECGGRGGVLLVGEPRRAPSAGPAVPAGAAVPDRQCGRVLRLLRDVRGLLLHRPVPGRGGRRQRVPDRAGLPADDRADDRRVPARRAVDQPVRAALVDLPRLPDVRGRPAAHHVHAQPAPGLPAARRGAGADRPGYRRDRGPDHLGGPVRGSAGPVRAWPPRPPTPAGRSGR